MTPSLVAFLLALISQAPPIELVESWPAETSLDHEDLRDTVVVWKEILAGAEKTIDFAHFYASDEERPTRLGAVIDTVRDAAGRGVRVRFLADAKFKDTYAATLDRLARIDGVAVRTLDLSKSGRKGVLHAKYLVADGRTVFIGSQNFDWRSLEHIQELGLRVESAETARAFGAVFEDDWARAAPGDGTPAARAAAAPWPAFPLALGSGSGATRLTPVFSPRELLPAGAEWDLPHLLRLIDGARKSVRVQLLTYRAASRSGEVLELDGALRRAAARGVSVELLLADWCQRKGTIEALQELEPLDHLAIRLVTIPPAAAGHIPYARCIHAKYLVVDGQSAWLGTSNWERDYFHESRNAGVVLEGGPVPARLDRFFTETWGSAYAAPVEPGKRYTPPRIGE